MHYAMDQFMDGIDPQWVSSTMKYDEHNKSVEQVMNRDAVTSYLKDTFSLGLHDW